MEREAVSPSPGAPAPYRPEIDGLRAVAVLAVLVHHLNPRLLPGGYLGVDVFFVISGFVITASLARRPAAGLVDLMLTFYGRRIRRLLPALLLCVLVSAVALCLVNPEPGQMLGVGWRALFGCSNLILHKLAVDYFRPAAELNPFTQTWSLGVEEQFYLLFPLLVWCSGFARRGRAGSRRLLWLLLPLVIGSFAVFVWQLGVDAPAAYYLLPGRFWELGVGSVLYLALALARPGAAGWEVPSAGGASAGGSSAGGSSARSRPQESPGLGPLGPGAGSIGVLPLVGLLALVGVLLLPLPFAALPVASAVGLTALVLGCLRPGQAAHGLLSWPPLVFLGLISYSLYLWHWSVLALARWTVGVNAITVGPLLALILGLAVLSWRLVEEPLRRNPWWPERWQVLATGVLLAAGGAAGLQGLTRYGSAALFTGDRNAAVYNPAAPAAPCDSSRAGRLLLAGDSHAHVFQAAADHLCRRHGLGYGEAATVGVPYPVLHYTNPATGMNREEALRFALVEEERWAALLATTTPPSPAGPPPGAKGGSGPKDIVVLALRWPLYFDPGFLGDASLGRTRHFDPANDAPLSRQQALERWIAAVGQIARDQPGLPIVLLLPTPEFGGEVPMQLCQPQWFRPWGERACGVGIERRPLERFSAHLQNQLRPLLAQHPKLLLHDPLPSLCPPRSGRCPRLRNGYLLYSDGDHLSRYGASLVLDDLLAALRRRRLLPRAPAAVPAAGRAG